MAFGCKEHQALRSLFGCKINETVLNVHPDDTSLYLTSSVKGDGGKDLGYDVVHSQRQSCFCEVH